MCDFGDLDRLIHESQGYLLRYAEHLLHDASSAQDAVQNAYVRYIRFVRKSGGVFRADNLRAWMLKTVRNLCMDHVKSASFRLETAWDESDLENVTAERFGENPEQQLKHREELLEVRRLVRTLSDAEQEVIALKFEEGRSYAEIAEIMGISTGYTGYLLHQAIGKLKAAYRAENGGADNGL